MLRRVILKVELRVSVVINPAYSYRTAPTTTKERAVFGSCCQQNAIREILDDASLCCCFSNILIRLLVSSSTTYFTGKDNLFFVCFQLQLVLLPGSTTQLITYVMKGHMQ